MVCNKQPSSTHLKHVHTGKHKTSTSTFKYLLRFSIFFLELQIGNEDPAARKAEIEKAKQAQLKGQKQGTNEWDASIASESESIVR